MESVRKPILVIGGNGYLGSTICEYAVAHGVRILVMCRTGRQKYAGNLNDMVEFVQGDAMRPETYKDILRNVSGIIHCVGTLVDSRTPLKINNKYEGSYEQLNRDSALLVIKTMQELGLKIPFALISAAKGWFFLPGYIETKREVEAYLANANPPVNHIVLRPGVMYSTTNKKVYVASFVSDGLYYQGQLLKMIGLSSAPNYFPVKAILLSSVAEAAIKSVQNQDLWNKTLEVQDINRIAGR
jgi:nucleoside-diphosphate-sugar epimerase